MKEDSSSSIPRSLATVAMTVALLSLVAIPAIVSDTADATHKPADKMAVSGSTLEVMNSGVSDGSQSKTVELLSGTMKTSGPADLIISVTAECALWTDVTTVGNDVQHAMAQVKVWVEIDGEPVAVSSDDTGEDQGKVVFCNRDYKVQTLQFDDEDATIERYMSSRHANAFHWTTLNVGSGEHDIAVMAQLEGEASETGFAKAAVGKRSLIVDSVKLANDVSL